MNKSAIEAFLRVLDESGPDTGGQVIRFMGTVSKEHLGKALSAAFQEMYTNDKVTGVTVDQESGELFVVMGSGKIWKRTREQEQEQWVWQEMEAVPGSIAAGGGKEPGYPIRVNPDSGDTPEPNVLKLEKRPLP